jgi:hypothetical protein
MTKPPNENLTPVVSPTADPFHIAMAEAFVCTTFVNTAACSPNANGGC